MININGNINVIGKWIIKYDDKYQMPQFVQGTIIGDGNIFKNGQTVIVSNIEYVDLKDKTMITKDGNKFKLVGDGKRMILLGENDILELKYVDKTKILKQE